MFGYHTSDRERPTADPAASPAGVRRPRRTAAGPSIGQRAANVAAAAPRSPATWRRPSGDRCRSQLTVERRHDDRGRGCCSTPPATRRTSEINAYALPVLIQETLDAQSAEHRHGERRDRDQRRLPAVAAERARPGGAVNDETGSGPSTGRARDGPPGQRGPARPARRRRPGRRGLGRGRGRPARSPTGCSARTGRTRSSPGWAAARSGRRASRGHRGAGHRRARPHRVRWCLRRGAAGRRVCSTPAAW